MTTDPTTTQTRRRQGADLKPNRRSRLARGMMSGLAVLGLGLAMTTALFTDNVMFGGDVAVAAPGQGTFKLQGAVTTGPLAPPGEGTWSNSHSTINFDLGVLHPNQMRTVVLWIRDASGATLSLPYPAVTLDWGDSGPPVGLQVPDSVTFSEASGPGSSVWMAYLTVWTSAEIEVGEGSFTIDVSGQGEGSTL